MKRWLTMLLTVGAVTVGGVLYFVAQPKDGITVADLVDGGIRDDCVKRRANCSFLHDGQYVHKLVEIGVCGADNTIVIPRKLARAMQNFDMQCQRTASCTGCAAGDLPFEADVADTVDITPGCRCRGAGTCNVIATGQPAVKDLTYDATLVTGAGCVPKVCVEVAGFSSMPDACK